MASPPDFENEPLRMKDQQSRMNEQKNWCVVSQDVGHATFTLKNVCSHPFEQTGEEEVKVGNLWMMSTVIISDTAVCHFTRLIFSVSLTCHAYMWDEYVNVCV